MSTLNQVSAFEVQVDPLTPQEKEEIVQQFFKNASIVNTENFLQFLEKLSNLSEAYIKKYDSAWKQFNTSFKIIETIKSNKLNSYSAWKRNQGQQETVENFIRVLLEGSFLLDYIREQITQQSIETNFLIKTNNDEYVSVRKAEVEYKIVLSNFGAKGNNYVSLAYSLSKDIKDALPQLQKTSEEMRINSQVYKGLDAVKDRYVSHLNSQGKQKTYIKYFDSTDAEIYEYMLQTKRRQMKLPTYMKLRQVMGGKGGYRTTSTQLGDVGLIQQKFFAKSLEANFARQTLIYNRFLSISKILSGFKNHQYNQQQVTNTFLTLFTETHKDKIAEEVSRAANAEAQKKLKELFKEGFKTI